jgi:hypothetical protein
MPVSVSAFSPADSGGRAAFGERDLAIAGSASRAVSPEPQQGAGGAPDIGAVLGAVMTAVAANAAGRQGGLAALYSNLAVMMTRTDGTVPQAVRAATQQVLAQLLPAQAGEGIAVDDLKLALARAGLAAADGEPGRSGTLNDALGTLRQALSDWLEAETPPVAAGEEPAVRDTLPPARTPAPMPPYRNGPTVPQAPVAATLPDDATPRETALHLLTETDAALARNTLLQIASVPDGFALGAARADSGAVRLIFDIPLLVAGQASVAQIAIERDASGPETPQDEGPAWRANFSVAFEPIGAVHARIAVSGPRATVTLFAERQDSARELRRGLPLLEHGLREAALEPSDIQCRSGMPAARIVPAPGQFLNQTT